jgi:hypothetical protein
MRYQQRLGPTLFAALTPNECRHTDVLVNIDKRPTSRAEKITQSMSGGRQAVAHR